MEPATSYSLRHSSGTVELMLTGERLIAKTHGTGLLDKLRIIDIPCSDLQKFCIVPTIKAQNLVGKVTDNAYDLSYDSEFIFSYQAQGKLKHKRMFVNSQDERFRLLLESLKEKCPGASLLERDPAEAQKEIGVLSASKALYIVIAFIVGLPIVIALTFVIFKIFL